MKHNLEQFPSPSTEPINTNWADEINSDKDINQEMVSLIKNSLEKKTFLETPPENWQNAFSITKRQLENKISIGTVIRIANKLGIEGKEFKDKKGQKSIFYSPEEVEKIINDDEIQRHLSLENPPEDWQNAQAIAIKQLEGKISSGAIIRAINRLDIKGEKFRGKDGNTTIFYPPQEIEKIINDDEIQRHLSLENPPEGWQNAEKIATEQLEGKISSGAIIKAINRLGIKGEEFKNKIGRATIFYSPQEVEKIISDSTIKKLLSLENPPEGWQNAEKIATEQLKRKVSSATVIKTANKLDIKGEEFKGMKGQGAIFYSPEEVKKIISDDVIQKLLSLGNPPEEWQNAEEIATKQLMGKISSGIIVRTANKLGIKGEEFKGKKGQGAIFYSPEEVKKIISDDVIQKHLSIENPPEGWQNAEDITIKQLEGKVSTTLITVIANKLGIKGEEFRGKNGNVAIFYSPQEIEKIINNEITQKYLSLENPPEGWQNAEEITTKQLEDKVAKPVVINAANKLGIKGNIFKGRNGKATIFYSPEEIERIIKAENVQKLLSLENPPEGWQNATDIATKQLMDKVSYRTISKIANKLGIKGKEYRGEYGKIALFYSPEDIEKIINDETIQQFFLLENPPEGWQNTEEIATLQLEGKVSRTLIARIANKLDIKGKEFRSKKGRKSIYYSPQEIEKIINDESIQKHRLLEVTRNEGNIQRYLSLKKLSPDNPPENWQNAEEIVFKHLNGIVTKTTVINAAKKLGVEGLLFKGKNGQPTIFYSPPEIERIINDKNIQKLLSHEAFPEGWQNAEEIATKQLGGKIGGSTIISTAHKLNINGKKYRGKNGAVTIFYSPEETNRIIKDENIQKLLSLENPPEGWHNTTEIATKVLMGRASHITISKTANKLGLNGKEFRNKSGKPTIFYSPEEQNQIIEEIESSTFGTSFPEQAIAYYLQQVNINAQQNIRPNWMKNPDTNRNLEIDLFIPFDNPPPPGIGIEYDGAFWHRNPSYDAQKNSLSRKEGIEIIHIREPGCPNLPIPNDGPAIPCIYRQDNTSNASLNECIEQILSKYFYIQLSNNFIDVSRDQAAILSFMKAGEKVIQNIDNIIEDGLKDGIFLTT